MAVAGSKKQLAGVQPSSLELLSPIYLVKAVIMVSKAMLSWNRTLVDIFS